MLGAAERLSLAVRLDLNTNHTNKHVMPMPSSQAAQKVMHLIDTN